MLMPPKVPDVPGGDYLFCSGRDDGGSINISINLVLPIRRFEPVAGDLNFYAPLGDAGGVLALSLADVFGECTADKTCGRERQHQQQGRQLRQFASFHYVNPFQCFSDNMSSKSKVSGSGPGFAAERMRRSSASSSRRSRRWASAARRRLNSSQPSGAAAHIGHDVAHFQRIRLDPAYERKVPDLQAVLSLAAHGAGEHDHWRQPENGGRPLRR